MPFLLPFKMKTMKKQYIILFCSLLFLWTGCTKEDTPGGTGGGPGEPEKTEGINGLTDGEVHYIGDRIGLEAHSEKAATFEWTIDGKNFSGKSISYTVTTGGTHTVQMTATAAEGSESWKLKFFALRPVTAASSKWISEVTEYRPAPGQFMNTAYASEESAEALVGGKAQTEVSLGTFGGYVTFRFDHTVLNGEGPDFVIHGNAFKGSSEPGAVMVAFDANGNGTADEEEWYELKGDAYDLASTVKGYTITYLCPAQTDTKAEIAWSDDRGADGIFPAGFYNRSYWPVFLQAEQLTFTGNRIDVTNNTMAEAWSGYADNFSPDYATVVNGDEDTANSNKFDISNAVDAAGQPVDLKGADFIRVYSAAYCINGILGEISPEIAGAISLSVK